MKLAELFAIADKLGAARVATGHYARIVRDGSGGPRLAMGADRAKDQSYFLYASPRAWLERLVFPLGESTKPEVAPRSRATRTPRGRTRARARSSASRGAGRTPMRTSWPSEPTAGCGPAPIVDEDGRTVGAHQGVHRFTIGQRRGLGVALGRPTFVARIDAASATVHLGGEDTLRSRSAELAEVCLADGIVLPLRASVKVRYRHDGDSGQIVASPSSGPRSARVVFDTPVRAVTRGQIAVFYDGDRVLGGGRISAVACEGEREHDGSPPLALRS